MTFLSVVGRWEFLHSFIHLFSIFSNIVIVIRAPLVLEYVLGMLGVPLWMGSQSIIVYRYLFAVYFLFIHRKWREARKSYVNVTRRNHTTHTDSKPSVGSNQEFQSFEMATLPAPPPHRSEGDSLC